MLVGQCPHCNMLSINGIACHERGCENSGSRWDIDLCEWVRVRECRECGCEIPRGEACDCTEPCGDDEEPSTWA